MKRFLPVLLLGLMACTETPLPVQDQDRRFDVVVIVSDALRQDALGTYGGPGGA